MTDKLKVHTTNYINTFIEVAEDTKVNQGTKPNPKGKTQTIAGMQYELIAENPYQYTSDDILFQIFADRNDLIKSAFKEARQGFFSKGQPCFRTSPLAKSHGFGIHHDSRGKVALYGMETKEYQEFLTDKKVKKIKAMRSSKKLQD